MNTDLRNRIVLPILLPIAILGGLALAVGGMALILLYNTRVLSLTIALIVATGVMVAISLASAIDAEDMTMGRRGAIWMAGLLPVVLGAGLSLWAANGGVPAEELMVNRQPVLSVPDGAVVAAQTDQDFCVFTDETQEVCEDTQEITLPAQPDSDVFRFQFVNIQAAIQHNFQIFELAGSADAPAGGEIVFGIAEGSALIEGPDEIVYSAPPLEAGSQWYFNCIVHPAMDGVLTIAEAGEDGADEGA